MRLWPQWTPESPYDAMVSHAEVRSVLDVQTRVHRVGSVWDFFVDVVYRDGRPDRQVYSDYARTERQARRRAQIVRDGLMRHVEVSRGLFLIYGGRVDNPPDPAA